MKIRILSLLFGALTLTMTSCTDEPGESTKVPTGTEKPDDTEKPEDNGDVISPTPNFNCDTQKVEINTSDKSQTIEGFGASDCWLPNQIGQFWSNNRLQIARWLFSRTISSDGQPQGIGLSMWRVNLGAGSAQQGKASNIDPNNRAESFYNSTGSYDWSRCVGQRYFMQQALDNGCESFVLFSNSPLVEFTKNGLAYSQSGAYANLKENCYGAFAEYMASVAEHFVKEGYNITHISPVNEPQYNWDGTSQEGSGWQNAEVARLVRELDKSLSKRSLDTEILLGEAGAWDYLYSGSSSDRKDIINAFFNPSSDAYVGDLKHVGKLISGHSYWTFDNWTDMRNIRGRVASATKKYGLKVWQTEWSMLDKCPSELGGNYDNISEFDIALYMSKIIHNDLTVAGCSSWSYWTAMSVERWSQKNRFELIKTTPAGGHYSDDFTAEGSVVATPNLWVLGNYSLFIRPGYVRVALSHKESRDFFGSAWLAPDGTRLVVVYTNLNKNHGVTLDDSTQMPGELKSVYTYTTSVNKNLKEVRFNIKDNVFLDPYSVTTVVYNF